MPRIPISNAVKAIILHMREMGFKLDEISKQIGVSTGKASEILRCTETREDEEVKRWLDCFRSPKIYPWPPEFVREKHCADCDTSWFCLDEKTKKEYEERYPELRGKFMDCHGAPLMALVHILWTKHVVDRVSISNSNRIKR